MGGWGEVAGKGGEVQRYGERGCDWEPRGELTSITLLSNAEAGAVAETWANEVRGGGGWGR